VGGPVLGEHASDSVVAGESTEWLDLWRLCIDSAGSRGGGIDGGESDASALPNAISVLMNEKLSNAGPGGVGNSNCVWN